MAVIGVSPPAVACLLTGVGVLAVLRVAWEYRGRPGARLWQATVGAIAVWILSYGVGLLVFDPELRALLEIPLWLGATLSIPLLLAFALEYTGRGSLVRSQWMSGLVLSWVVVWLLYATNPLHQLMWTEYSIDPAFGAATVSYTPQPGLVLAHVYAYVLLTLASLLLVEAIVSYESVFRVQGMAVLVGVFLPTVANVFWLFGLGPVPQLNLTPIAFAVTAGAGLYAFFVEDMFELSPAVRQLGEEAAIDDLRTPVVVVDIHGRIITLNDAAVRLFDTTAATALTRPLSEFTETPVELAVGEQVVTQSVGNRRREFEVSVADIEDAASRHVGYTLVFADITDERQRRQRLEVTSRLLRHNLRNELAVVTGRADLIVDQAEESTMRSHATAITTHTERLATLSDKMARAANVLDNPTPGEVEVSVLLEGIRDDVEGATIEITAPDSLPVRSNRDVLSLVLLNLVENAVEHNDGTPTVDITAAKTPEAPTGGVRITVSDDGPGIPSHELAPLESGEETSLEHGSGLGLWLVYWGATVLGGTVDFETGADGTTVTLQVPHWEEETVRTV